ncbi:hypothetical protein B0H17DRAFT_924902 [Mycena rosella]|uniref:BTB domain-containing protein n=1 Tax=Mycena rosella TaxID=1033263 RepID=A0AAD7DW81_MYCRO|nr:hypothetical protein B0H17DRAFT_924902 [Mycena rosella]
MDIPTELVRSADFWFNDGTVVLQVEKMLYRVYRGLLASHSTVFHDTFSIPQPAEGAIEIEGCPVVQLHDKERDFTRFLKALHHCGSYKTCAVSGFSELKSILLLSDKYDVAVLRDSMTSILSDLYPTSLGKWTDRKLHRPPGYSSYIPPRDHVSALNVAVKMNMRSILPAIMYDICTRSELEAIVFGMGQTRLKIEKQEYRKICIAAIPSLMKAQRRALGYLKPSSLDDECEDRASCDAECLRWFALDLGDEDFDPLDDSNSTEWENFAVCPSCLESAKAAWSAVCENLWDDLPRIFDVGTWDNLLLA